MDRAYVCCTAGLIGSAVDLIRLCEKFHTRWSLSLSCVGILLQLWLIVQWLEMERVQKHTHSSLMTAGSSLLVFSFALRSLFRYVVYPDLHDAHSSWSRSYLLFWKSRLFHRTRLGWRRDDLLENNWVCLSSMQCFVHNFMEFFWDSSIVALVNVVTGVVFLIITTLLIIFYLIYYLFCYCLFVFLFCSLVGYSVVALFDLVGALFSHLISSDDIFAFHILRIYISFLERCLRSIYCLEFPLLLWLKHKPFYPSLTTVLHFILTHVVIGSRSFVLLEKIPHVPQSLEIIGAPEVSFVLPSSSLLWILAETILCSSAGLIISRATRTSSPWESNVLLVITVLTLLIEAISLLSQLHRKFRRVRVKAEVVDSEMSWYDIQQEDGIKSPHEPALGAISG